MSNDEQIAFWNGAGGTRWIAARDRIEQSVVAISEALFATAAARPGERVLDVGCGCGRTTAALQRLTGASALGVDVSAPMVARAREQIQPGLEFVEGDASRLPFPATYDLVFSRFGVMFFADPVAAFGHLRGALAPAGRLVFACWRDLALNPWSRVPLEAAQDLLPPAPPADPNAPGPYAFADGGRLREILVRAGFHDVAIGPLESVMRMGETLDEAAIEATTIGPLARRVGDLTADKLAEVRARVAAAYAPFVTPRGVEPPAAVWLVTARAARAPRSQP